MSAWLYQINQETWSPQRYRAEIWESTTWNWGVSRKVPADQNPELGDTLVFYYAPSGGDDPGFYGWAVIQEWLAEEPSIYFRPTAPSDHLKMHPWWDEEAEAVANEIRGKVKQGTLWLIEPELEQRIREGFTSWIAWADSGE